MAWQANGNWRSDDISEEKELFCIGYAAFAQKWHMDEGSQQWFQSYVKDVTTLAHSKYSLVELPDRGKIVSQKELREELQWRCQTIG